MNLPLEKFVPKIEKLCWFCQHFTYIQATPDYSDLTPGSAFEMCCLKQHWQFDPYETTQEEFGKILTTARKCQDFIPIASLLK